MGCCSSKKPPPASNANKPKAKPNNNPPSRKAKAGTKAPPQKGAAKSSSKPNNKNDAARTKKKTETEIEAKRQERRKARSDKDQAQGDAATLKREPFGGVALVGLAPSQLQQAVKEGDLDKCREAIKAEGVSLKDANDMTALHHMAVAVASTPAAAMPKDADWTGVLELLLKEGAEINARNSGAGGDATPLLLLAATQRRHRGRGEGDDHKVVEKVARAMLAKGADANAANKEGVAPLLAASLEARAGVVRALLDGGVNANARDKSRGFAALHGSVVAGSVEVAKMLLDAGADIELRDRESGQTPLSLALRLGRHSVAEELLKAGADVECRDGEGNTPLHFAVLRHSLKMVEMLLERGVEADAKNEEGESPLHCINKEETEGGAEITRLLVKIGCDVNRRGAMGRTPIWGSAAHGDVEATLVLLEAGADAGVVDEDGETAMHTAGSRQVAEALWKKGAVMDVKSIGGETPLFNAVRRCDEEAVSFLLSHGSDPNAVSVAGACPLGLAVIAESPSVASLLLEAGADANGPPDRDGDRPLDLAADVEMVGLLLSAGASPDKKY